MSKSSLITCAEFQLLLDDNPDYVPDHWQEPRFTKGNGKKPVLGLSPGAAQAFCDWITQREGDTEWIYRLPQKSEVNDGECCWQTKDNMVELSHPQIIEMTVTDWLIDSENNIPDKLLTEKIRLQYYDPTYIALDRTNFLASALDRARANTRTRANTLDRTLALALTRSLDRNRDLASSHAPDRSFDFARALALTQNHSLTRPIAIDLDRVLALDLDRARALTPYLTRSIDLNHIIDLANKLVNNLTQIMVSDERLRKLVDLFMQVARIIKGYIELAMILNGDYPNFSPVHLLQEWGEVGGFRWDILQHAFEHYQLQPQQTELSSGSEWETWKHKLDILLQAYAMLVMYEKRRTGEWEPFEGLRIVKARRKD
ncbi:MAG: hypothetical protein K8L97_11745 [Anaerolineae bacterium]|nr:hypothetical protein [Anaerolineae bacterium]